MRLLSLPSTLARLEPFHQMQGGELEDLRSRLEDQRLAVLPGTCSRCGGLVTVETCSITRPGQDPPRATRTVWRCHHHFHQRGPAPCPPRTADIPDPSTTGKENHDTVPTDCPICGQPAPGRSTYCSTSCRQRAYRLKSRSTATPATTPDQAPETVIDTLSVLERILALPKRARAALRGMLQLEEEHQP